MSTPNAYVDYAKWVINGQYDVVMRKASLIAQAYEIELPRAETAKPNGLKSGDYHDGKRQCHVCWVEVYGPVADAVVQAMGATFSECLVRLDWRNTVAEEQFTYQEMYRAMKSRANANNTFMEMDSKERTKMEGRDSGGQSLYSGAAGSDRRFVYYKRAKEQAAVECRFLHKMCQRVVESAKNVYVDTKRGSFYDCLTFALDDYSGRLCEERTGLPLTVVTGEELRGIQHKVFAQQESLLMEFEEMVSQADPETLGAMKDMLDVDVLMGHVRFAPVEE